MINKNEITGVILAGGKSKRLGTDKSLIKYKGKTLIENAIDILNPICGKIVISANSDNYLFTGCEIWKDLFAIQAPMIGIYSSLQKTETDTNIILSCDMPFITPDLLNYLLKNSFNFPLITPQHNNKIEPLCAIYKKSLIPNLKNFIEISNYRLYEFIQSVNSNYLNVTTEDDFYHPDLFFNVNSPDDLKKFPNLFDNNY